MASVYRYHMTQDHHDELDEQNLFTINLHFDHVLELYYPQTLHIPLRTIHQFYTVPRQLLLSLELAQRFVRFLLSETGASMDFVEAAATDISSFALEMIVNDACNANRRVLSMVLMVLVVTPYDEHGEIERAIGESFREGVKFRPASKESIEGLLRFEDSCGVNKCVICLEESLVGVKVARMPCGHVFHRDCIVRWLETSHLCPLCRYQMPS
ncbi:hypothetical protein HS088_TW15G01015 [Tripterygium wilfordii]|uniref:RING-type E3 ubiquitin transferase n=1 Tax=Tripterygium wilfordii TaxID=458696 RepID=A0A7J7CND6_TRIWF|nr:E3 ubiquitin-protein ligase SGR9, amyloplastic-like [Tripterygium wilfordii]KAF5735508.1 hypothetical protein HS088_TW15G01015 [Tripterygium wilfordii]